MAEGRSRKKNARLDAVLCEEKQPTSLKAWRAKYHNIKLLVRFENGEQNTLDIKKVEPDVFEEPREGDEVCCNVGGGRYGAVVMECIYGKAKEETAAEVKKKPKKRPIVMEEKTEETPKKRKIEEKAKSGSTGQESIKVASKEAKSQLKQLKALKEDMYKGAQLDHFSDSVEWNSPQPKPDPALNQMKQEINKMIATCITKSMVGYSKQYLMEVLKAHVDKKFDTILDKLDNVTAGTSLSTSTTYRSLSQVIEEGKELQKRIKLATTSQPEEEDISFSDEYIEDLEVLPNTPEDNSSQLEPSAKPYVAALTSNTTESVTDASESVKDTSEPVTDTAEPLAVPKPPKLPKPSPNTVYHVQYVTVGHIRVPKAKLESARHCKDANKMARRLLPEFFSQEELQTNMCVPPKSAKYARPQADSTKMSLLLGEVTKVYPSGWDEKNMMSYLNQCFIDNRKKKL